MSIPPTPGNVPPPYPPPHGDWASSGFPVNATPGDPQRSTMLQAAMFAPQGITQDERTMGMLSHILCIFGFVGPLVIYLVKKDQSRFVAYHALQAMFLQLAMIVGIMASIFLAIAGMASHIGSAILLYPIVLIVSFVYHIVAGLAANKGEWYEIPLVGKLALNQVGGPALAPPGYNTAAGYPQSGYPQSGYPQTGYSRSGYPQNSYAQSGYPQLEQPPTGVSPGDASPGGNSPGA